MRVRFPTAYTILFILIIFVAGLTWIVPAGKYTTAYNEALGKDVPVPGTYQLVEQNPQGLRSIILAPIAGFYDPVSYTANAIDVALFVLVIGGFIAVVTRTGAISAGIAKAMGTLRGREKWMIPVLMALFAFGGTTYGMAEETLAFYALIIPVMIAAGYDSVTGVAVILIGAGIGVLGSTVNAFATVIASDAAGVPFTQGLILRSAILGLGWLCCVGFVMRYAERVRREPARSVVADRREAIQKHFQSVSADVPVGTFTGRHKIILALFALTFAVMIWGVSAGGWWMAEMTGLFLVSAIVIGLIGRATEGELTSTFVRGAGDIVGVALVVGLARGIVVVMNDGLIADTILHWSEQAVSGLSHAVFINVVYWIEVLMSFFVPSSSGLAVLSMPILAPLGDFAGVDRHLIVTAYQSANGLVNLINPTFAVVIGGLAIGQVPYERWLKFMWPLLLALTVLIMGGLTAATLLR
jgi:uncharacterized ion transporter superfamily protein YfcC